MNQPNPYESANAEHPTDGKRSNTVFVVIAILTALCMLLVSSLFLGVSQVQTVPVSSPVPAVQPTTVPNAQPPANR